MPQRNQENASQQRPSILKRAYEVLFGSDEDYAPRTERYRAEAQAAADREAEKNEAMKKTQERVRELTGKHVLVIPQSEADNLASTFIGKKDPDYRIGFEDAKRIIKSVRRKTGAKD
jgi:hypothetical protein